MRLLLSENKSLGVKDTDIVPVKRKRERGREREGEGRNRDRESERVREWYENGVRLGRNSFQRKSYVLSSNVQY